MEQFTKLGLSTELTDVLKQFGFKQPSEIQQRTIPLALSGRDIIGGSATGSGKTLAFASPIIENLIPNDDVQALVLTPTRELAEQVATSIRNFGKNKNLNVAAVYGGVNIDPQIRGIAKADILVGTPGRIIDHLDRGTLRLDGIKFLVLDEVDRMFDMGFSKDVELIINKCPKKRQTMMFSATIFDGINYLSKKYTKDPAEISLQSYVDYSKLKQIYYDVPDNKKFSLLVGLLKKENAELVMVFCNTRRNVDFITGNLIESGIRAKAIHGGIEQLKRMKVLDEFHDKKLGVLVCTDVAARGLDIKGVSHVYNYDTPPDPKDYVHRIGRTARAGGQGKAVTILSSKDYENFRALMQAKDIKIEPEELPPIDFVNIKINPGRTHNQFRGSNRRDFGRGQRRGPSRGSSRGSSKGNSNRGQRSSSIRRSNNRRRF